MSRQTDLAYIAGLADGEAYIGIKKTPAYESQRRKSPSYHARIQIRMVSEEAIKFISDLLGGFYYREKPHSAQGRPLFCYQASDKNAEAILRAVLPYLKVKRETAEVVLRLRKLQSNAREHLTKVTGHREFVNPHGTVRRIANRALSDEYLAECEALYLRCKELNRVGL